MIFFLFSHYSLWYSAKHGEMRLVTGIFSSCFNLRYGIQLCFLVLTIRSTLSRKEGRLLLRSLGCWTGGNGELDEEEVFMTGCNSRPIHCLTKWLWWVPCSSIWVPAAAPASPVSIYRVTQSFSSFFLSLLDAGHEKKRPSCKNEVKGLGYVWSLGFLEAPFKHLTLTLW